MYIVQNAAVVGKRLLFKWGIVEQLLNEVHMAQQHPPAAVSLEAQGIKCITFLIFGLEETEIRLPLVTYHLPTGETPDRDDHPHRRLNYALCHTKSIWKKITKN